MNQRGFFLPALGPLAYGAIAAGVVIVGLGVAVKVQSARLDSVKAEYSAFKTQVETLGREAEKAARKAELEHQQAKEQADEKAKKLLADNASLGKRLRDARASGGYVPKPPDNSPSPNRACFDRAELERAISNLDGGIQSLISQGDAFQLRLATSAEWAKSVGVGTPLVPK